METIYSLAGLILANAGKSITSQNFQVLAQRAVAASSFPKVDAEWAHNLLDTIKTSPGIILSNIIFPQLEEYLFEVAKENYPAAAILRQEWVGKGYISNKKDYYQDLFEKYDIDPAAKIDEVEELEKEFASFDFLACTPEPKPLQHYEGLILVSHNNPEEPRIKFGGEIKRFSSSKNIEEELDIYLINISGGQDIVQTLALAIEHLEALRAENDEDDLFDEVGIFLKEEISALKQVVEMLKDRKQRNYVAPVTSHLVAKVQKRIPSYNLKPEDILCFKWKVYEE